MSPEKIDIIKTSFSKVAVISDKAAEIFYSKLFEKDPTLKPLFKGDMKEQGRKLMSMIGTAVGSLSNPEILLPVVQNLGKSHVKYGVKKEMYTTVGESLIETLSIGLGAEFTTEVEEAWVEVYTLLSSTMIAASEEV